MSNKQVEPVKWWIDPTPEERAEQGRAATECDRLAELEAKRTGKRRWGRWYLSPSKPISLDTRSVRSYFKGGKYDIVLYRCNTKAERKNWLEHLARKNWMGEQGIKDLACAFEDLLKEGLIKK